MTPIKELLPIGSIVVPKGSERKVMIAGVKHTSQENPDKEYDYMGFLYPEGHIADDVQFVFDDSDIERIIFRGFEDIERQEFIARLEQYYNSQE